jgi:hypothetical protein
MTSTRWPGTYSASIQFHAAPDEILEFVDGCASNIELFVVFIWTDREFRVRSLPTPRERADAVSEHGVPRFVRLTLHSPSLDVRSDAEFVQKNPGCFLIEIGAEAPDSLGESFAGYRTTDEKASKAWSRLAGRLRRMTTAGAVAVNAKTKEQGAVGTHRYTQKAAEKAQAGVRLWALGGQSFYVPAIAHSK